jgi:spermidine synthase
MSKPPSHSSTTLTRLYLGAACFLAGAAMMVIEICAFRLLAPLFGNSVYTWTALIGVILIAFSVGGFMGGRLADKHTGLNLLGWLLAGSAVLTFLIPPLHLGFGESFTSSGLIGGSVMVSLFLFALPGALLGAVSPAAVRFYSLTLKDTHVGQAAGTVSMLGSLGSFVGTFLSGFVLLSHFGVRSIFIGCGVLLLLLAVLAFLLGRHGVKTAGTVAAVGIAAAVLGALAHEKPGHGVIHTQESFYHRIEVSEAGTSPHRQRLLKLDSTPEGAMNPDTGDLVMEYQHYWRLPLLKDQAKLESALFIGAGAFGMPEVLSREFPQARVDVAEIDPQVIEAGRQFFKLSEHPRVQAHAGDARHFLRSHQDQRWDLIFGDAYAGVRSIPSHLVTKEFFQLVSDHLTPEGIFVMNAISAVQGDKAELLSGLLATLKTVFPHVEAFAVQGPRLLAQNVIILASRQDWKPWITDRFYAAGTWQNRILQSHVAANQLPQKGQIFTDDFNPVDHIIAQGLLE